MHKSAGRPPRRLGRVGSLAWLSPVPLWLAGCLGAPSAQLGTEDALYGQAPDLAPYCTGNNDGVIEAGELSFPVGATVRYLVNPVGTTVGVAPDGMLGTGGPEWDFRSTAGEVRDFTLVSPNGAWWQARFPTATYAVTADIGSATLGVFEVRPGGLFLLGFVSEAPNQTLLVYDAPVASLRFPVQKGDAFVTGAKITGGLLGGQPFASSDTYRISVDAVGAAVLPYLRFEKTLRVKVESSQTLPAGVVVSKIQYLYYHECYGELGRMVSTPGETNQSFTNAAEFRRLAL